MEKRQEKLLQLIVDSYLQTAEPVGSKFLIESSDLGLSGATVRNEMRDLEEKGFLGQPHTSAGRIPTEAGYRYYIENIMKAERLKNKIKIEIELTIKSDKEFALKNIAKQISEYVGGAVILALHSDIYYTGISNLFAQPEFHDYDYTVRMSNIFDQCEDLINDIYDLIDGRDTKILIGKENPLGNSCSAVVIKVGDKGLFAILGPMRMDYEKSVGLLNYISEII